MRVCVHVYVYACEYVWACERVFRVFVLMYASVVDMFSLAVPAAGTDCLVGFQLLRCFLDAAL